MAEVKGNFLTRKLGPMPMYGWMGGLLAVLIGVSLYKNKSSTAATAAATDSTSTDTVPSDQVPDYITQVYNTVNATTGQPATTTAPPTTTPVTPKPPTTPPVNPVKAPTPVKKPTPVTVKKPAPTPVKAKTPISYKVQHGDTLTSIAKKYGTTWQALWTYNTTSGVRPAATIATLKQRGPNLLYSGETILIPQK